MRRVRLSTFVVLALLALPSMALANPQSGLQQIEPGSVPIENISKSLGNGGSISVDGRFVAFTSVSALVPEDVNEDSDVYVYDRETGTFDFIGIPNDQSDRTYLTRNPVISADGRFISFRSDAPSFVPDDENGFADAFVFDRADSSFTRVSLTEDGAEADADVSEVTMSADGGTVAFHTTAALVPEDKNSANDIYIVDRANGSIERAIDGNGDSESPSLSTDGRYVTFASTATNLVVDDLNGERDIFVLDRQTGVVERVSVSSSGEEANAASRRPVVSADGRYVVFLSRATNLAAGGGPGWHVYLHDRETGNTEQIDLAADGSPADDESSFGVSTGIITSDGNQVIFSTGARLTDDDANDALDVYIRDRSAGTTALVSRSVFGVSGNDSSFARAISPDGRFVVFSSNADNMVYFDDIWTNDGLSDVFVRDMDAPYPASPFEAVHDRTDLPVAEGQAQRTWTWAPDAMAGVFYEPYGEQTVSNLMPYESRMVQYYDKSRMEITHHEEDPNSVWYVTNGLLVTEMMTGSLQVNDDAHLPLTAAWINVAGDMDDPDGPTYAGLAGLRDAPPHPFDQPIISRVDRQGNVTSDDALAPFDVQVAVIDDVTGHGIAAPFWDFMTSSGTVWTGDSFVIDQLFENEYFATGRPLIEAYWAEVLVGGQPRDVLMQCFERRCLTYTPGNPEGFIVEAGNVGLHYYSWRYSVPSLAPDLSGSIVFSDSLHLNVVDRSGVRELFQAPAGSEIVSSAWSPDGSQIAYILWGGALGSDLYVIDADGGNVRQLTFDGAAGSPSWSPGGNRIAFESDGSVVLINADGTGRTEIGPGRSPAWSPVDQDRIAFVESDHNGQVGEWLKTMDASGNNITDVVLAPINGVLNAKLFSGYSWSPDGTQFAYAGEVWRGTSTPGSLYDLYVVNVDGTNNLEIDTGGSEGLNPGWSPDGSRLTYVREHVVYTVRPDGTDTRGVLWDFGLRIADYDWTAGM